MMVFNEPIAADKLVLATCVVCNAVSMNCASCPAVTWVVSNWFTVPAPTAAMRSPTEKRAFANPL